MQPAAGRRAALLLTILVAGAFIGRGEELSPELESAILHGIQQARNEAGKHLEDYTKAVLRIVEPLLQKSIKGQWYIMIYGNDIPMDCKHFDECYFDLIDELASSSAFKDGIPADHHDTPYSLVIFTKGFIDKCDVDSGSQNWWFSYHKDTTSCYTEYPKVAADKEDCSIAGKCYVEWDCPERSCFTLPAPSPGSSP